MFLITNRDVRAGASGPEALGSKINPLGPNELRVAEATKVDGRWKVSILPDACTPEMLQAAGIPPSVDARGNPAPVPASKYVAYRTLLRLKAIRDRTGADPALVLFVHGFNNDVAAVLERAQGFQDLYGVEVVAFTWPADGGGSLSGTLSYKSDKRDALASVGAFDRTIIKLDDYVREMNAPRVARIEEEATNAHPEDADEWDGHFTTRMRRDCPFTTNLVLHSMGNYLYKSYMSSTTYSGHRLVFDNVLLVAADANNPGHSEWVDRIQCRRRVYITINEDDVALRASRMKAGEEQRARLGHWPYDLDSRRAVYVDFTRADDVDDSHAYFEGRPVERNGAVRKFFHRAMNGQDAERDLRFDVGRNMFVVD